MSTASTDTLAIVRALDGDYEERGTYSENTRALIKAIGGDSTSVNGPISTETKILCKAFLGDYEGADSRLSTNGRAIVRALQGDYDSHATVSNDTREIIDAIKKNLNPNVTTYFQDENGLTYEDENGELVEATA